MNPQLRLLSLRIRTHWYYYLLVLGLTILCYSLWRQGPQDGSKAARNMVRAHEAGEIARTHDYVRYWMPMTSKAGFFVCLGLLLTGPWLVAGTSQLPRKDQVRPGAGKWLCFGTACITLSVAAANAPRLHHSFWFDEECTARRFMVGEFSADGRFTKPTWERTLFYYNDPNNHPLCSVLGRIGHSLVGAPTGPHDFHFREWAIRLPLFLVGLGGLSALAWLATVAGHPKAGMFAVVLMSLHPWFVRYSVEARGYTLLFAFVPLALGCLLRALQSGRLGWFLAFGLLEFLCLWSYPGVLYLLFMVNGASLAWIWLNRSEGMDRTTRRMLFRRFCAGNIIGAILSALLLSPLVFPMLAYLKAERMRGEVTLSLIAESLSGLFTGQPWAPWGEHPHALALSRTWDESPLMLALCLAGLAGFLALGLASLGRRSDAFRWIGAAVLATGPFMVVMARLQGNILYPWYVVFTLPVVLLVIGMGLELAVKSFRHRVAGMVVVLAAIGGFSVLTWRQNSLLRNYPIEPMRESVVAMRPLVNPFSAEVHQTLSASLCYSLRLYDPWATPVKELADLETLMMEAKASRKPLVINFANLGFARLRFPEVMRVLENKDLFTADPPYFGLHAQPERWVFRYLGSANP